MKGKNTFTADEINRLEGLIDLRNRTHSSGQKAIRDRMRKLGFYGKDDWGITNLQRSDLTSLIESGRISIISTDPKSVFIENSIPTTTSPRETQNTKINLMDVSEILNFFSLNSFDPKVDDEMKIDDRAGNYFFCLRKNSQLPRTKIIPIIKEFQGLKVIYTGIASKSLRTRDYKQHFKGNNSGKSTIRKSLGVLFGYKQIPRDLDVSNNKTKFSEIDEQQLTEWMSSNLLLFFFPTKEFAEIEHLLISYFNPPLNLKHNKNITNQEFRTLLRNLRRQKP